MPNRAYRWPQVLMLTAAGIATTVNAKPVLEEVVVTAQKRAESLSDVPVSVSAVSGEKLNKAGISNMADLSEYTPNFKLVPGGLIPNVYMRGVGSGSNQGFELSVGIFADGIHLGRPHQTRAAFMDIERVEVLRGPQSILFGKNAIAGALNIVSGRPGDEFEGMVSGLVGFPRGRDNDREEYSAMVSVPVTDTFGFRLAGRKRSEDGYMYNENLKRVEPGVDEKAARLTLGWYPLDWTEAYLKLEHSNREQRGRTFEFTHASALTGCSGEDVELNRVKNTDAEEFAEIDTYNYTLNVDMNFEPGTLTMTSGWSGFESEDLFDADSSSFDTVPLLGLEEYDQFSQEFRFASTTGGFVDYIAGAFYQTSELQFDESSPLNVRNGALQDFGACAINTVENVKADLARDFSIDSDAWSAFVQVTFNWTSNLRTTLGVRHVVEEKTGFRDFDVYEPGTKNDVNPVTATVLNALLINKHTLSGERDVAVTLPSVNVQWDVTDDIMTYIGFTRGAKSGSYDARNNNDGTGPNGGATNFEFEDELADAWELGAKMRLADGAAELNIAVYRVEYEDMQVSVFDGVAGFTVTNAGSALTQGIELDGRWLLTENFMLSGSMAYLDFEWLDYVDGPCYGGAPNEDPDTGTCDLTGRENQHTPEWTGTVSGTYTQPLFNSLMLELGVDLSYKGEHFTSGDLDPRGIQESVEKINARIALSDVDETWSLAVVGRNLTDETTIGIGSPSALDAGGYRATIEPTKVVYVEGRYRF
ncbi:TonB-dependent receptor [Litorivivens sp.]|uniref:TonB-dependent receptor n=1 Tax=Litorivivens sp. TaxID=2020868 RepID=UPI0035653E77